MPGPHTPLGSIEKFRQEGRTKNLREVMRKARVPEPDIEKIIEAEIQETEIFWGYVRTVATIPDKTSVWVHGASKSNQKLYELSFPPNSKEYLTELIRAQTHPHLRVQFETKEKPGSEPMISYLQVFLDYDEPYIEGQPKFTA